MEYPESVIKLVRVEYCMSFTGYISTWLVSNRLAIFASNNYDNTIETMLVNSINVQN